jgi:hypothetical protein
MAEAVLLTIVASSVKMRVVSRSDDGARVDVLVPEWDVSDLPPICNR